MPTRRNKRTSDTPSEDANNDRSGSDSTSRHKKQKTNENTNDNTTELKNVTLKITYYTTSFFNQISNFHMIMNGSIIYIINIEFSSPLANFPIQGIKHVVR